MDQNDFKLIAQFKVLFTKETGQKMDLVRFAGDKVYAKQLLTTAAQSDKEELLIVTMRLMKLLGFMPVEQESTEKTDPLANKYVGGLR